MMVRVLIIDKPGLTINIKGLPIIRTPARIDVSQVDINLVVMELKKYGLDQYQIVMEPVKKKEVIKKSKKKQESVDLTSVYDRFDKIDKLLERIISRPSEIQTIVREADGPETPTIEELGTDEFIPNIDISDLKVSKESTRTKEMDDDVSDEVELLRMIGKKPGG